MPLKKTFPVPSLFDLSVDCVTTNLAEITKRNSLDDENVSLRNIFVNYMVSMKL